MWKDKKKHYNVKSDTSDYHRGYLDGMNASFESSELDAYYAGVGYGKKMAGDKHLGFNSDEERQEFEKGMKNKNKHFRTYRAEKPSLLERLFFKEEIKKDRSIASYKKQRESNLRKQLNKKRKQNRKTKK